jgi:hypothetical protein
MLLFGLLFSPTHKFWCAAAVGDFGAPNTQLNYSFKRAYSFNFELLELIYRGQPT